MLILAPISAGELFDKITILQIKVLRVTDKVKLDRVRDELQQLEELSGIHVGVPDTTLQRLIDNLFAVNSELWDIEEGKRLAESKQVFDDNFVQLARSVYLKNDVRARLKREINEALGSAIVEVKSHSGT